MQIFFLFSVIQFLVSAEKTCSNSFRNETIDCSDDEPRSGESVMVIYNDVTTSRAAQRIPFKDKN